MFARYFLTLNLFVLLAAVISGNAAEQTKLEISNRIEPLIVNPQSLNAGFSIVLRILEKAFAWAATRCLKQAANHCKQHWRHPEELLDCAKNFLRTNKGRCILGLNYASKI